ncbi:MAG: aldo/keto reductase [Blastocatellia bacterium]|nr:aldo/keto reductase [Blastocatellia bacterium]
MNKIATTRLADMEICQILNGMWQVSGAHGQIEAESALKDMFSYADAGMLTWDLADHYGPAEDFVGEFRRRFRQLQKEALLAQMHFFTKWVPQPTLITKKIVAESVERSLRRMDTETIDLLQFHWWEYEDSSYLKALEYLSELVVEGKIKHLGLTNFDTEHLKIITGQGINIVSNQVQYSIIDMRPSIKMAPFCIENNIGLLTYGAVCGGFLSESYLGKREPNRFELTTASLRKYKQMIDVWGGWELFQMLLRELADIAVKHRVSIANIAIKYILQRPEVTAVIVGARLGIRQHIADNSRIFRFQLDDEEIAKIEAIQAESRNLMNVIGDCGDEYRK